MKQSHLWITAIPLLFMTGFTMNAEAQIRTTPSSPGAFQDTLKRSLRTDGLKGSQLSSHKTLLTYEHLRTDDALYIEKVWREIDTREKINLPFRYRGRNDQGDQLFATIILDAVRSGRVMAFSPEDDQFTSILDSTQFARVLSIGNCDSIPIYNLPDPTRIDRYELYCPTLDPEDITIFRIKEEWIFDKESSRLFVRIIGIAPCKTVWSTDKTRVRGYTPLFWVYYPDLRHTLAQHEVYNPKNSGGLRMSWEELFEARMFSSTIIKSTIDNPFNRNLRSIFRDPILALLEGENVKEKIFKFELDLWSY